MECAKRNVGFVMRCGMVLDFGLFRGVCWCLWRVKRDVGFMIRCGMVFDFGLFGGFFRRLWRVKRDVGFVIQGFWWKVDPTQPWPWPLI